MFEYVSGANYFGETVEWIGYAIACWNLPAAMFAVFSACVIGTRACQHHKYVHWLKLFRVIVRLVLLCIVLVHRLSS